MEAHVKAYLVQKFDTGCRTGQKADPVQVAREMKIVKDDAGHLLFTPIFYSCRINFYSCVKGRNFLRMFGGVKGRV